MSFSPSLLPESYVSPAGHSQAALTKEDGHPGNSTSCAKTSIKRHNPPPDSTISEKSANWYVATKTDTNPPRQAQQKPRRQNLANPHHKRLRARFITRHETYLTPRFPRETFSWSPKNVPQNPCTRNRNSSESAAVPAAPDGGNAGMDCRRPVRRKVVRRGD